MTYKIKYSDELAHHGILGQKWGVRRYQNADGTRTEAGKKRYSSDGIKQQESKKLTSEQKEKIKKAAMVIGSATALSAATYFYVKNKASIDTAVSGALNKVGKYTPRALKEFAKGAKEGAKNAPYKIGKAVGEGMAIGVGMAAVRAILPDGEADQAIRQYNAFNKKNKINLSAFDKKDEEDDD